MYKEINLERLINSKIKNEDDVKILKKYLLNFSFFKKYYKILDKIYFDFMINSLKLKKLNKKEIIIDLNENINYFYISLVPIFISIPKKEVDIINHSLEKHQIIENINLFKNISTDKHLIKNLKSYFLFNILKPGEYFGDFNLIHNEKSSFIYANLEPGYILYIEKEVFNLVIKQIWIKKIEIFYKNINFWNLVKKIDFLNHNTDFIFYLFKKKSKNKNYIFNNLKNNVYIIIKGRLNLKDKENKKNIKNLNKKLIISNTKEILNKNIKKYNILTKSKVIYYKLNFDWYYKVEKFKKFYFFNNLKNLDLDNFNKIIFNIQKNFIKIKTKKEIFKKLEKKKNKKLIYNQHDFFESEKKLSMHMKRFDKIYYIEKKKKNQSLVNISNNSYVKLYKINNLIKRKNTSLTQSDKNSFINNNSIVINKKYNLKNRNLKEILNVLFKNNSNNNGNIKDKIKKKNLNFFKIKKIQNKKLDLNKNFKLNQILNYEK